MLSLVFSLSYCMFSYAQENDNSKPIGILTNEQGVVTEIEGVLVDEKIMPATRASDLVKYERTYMYAVPRAISGEVTVDEVDDGYVTRAYLTIEYSSTPDREGDDLFVLNKVRGYWTDPTDQAWVENSYIDYACVEINDSTQRNMGVPVSNHFSISTGYTKGVPDWAGGILGANLHLNLRRGTSSSWNLTVYNLLFGAL